MEILYATKKIEEQCNSLKVSKKLFGGDAGLARSLMAAVNALTAAKTIKDIIVQPGFHFHKLQNKGRHGKNLDGFFAIDIKSRRSPWRLILQPLDEKRKPFVSCNIDEISDRVRIVRIEEVSNHYE